MDTEALTRPAVSIAYVVLTIQIAEERGVSREHLLKDVDLSPELLAQPDARIPLLQYGHIISRALRLTGDPGLGLEYGLRATLTVHGHVDTVLARAYDYEKLGWKYERFECDPGAGAPYHTSCGPDHDVSAAPPPGPDGVANRTIYNTHAYSKGSGGHAYTKVLTDAERRALVEYLKTL